MSKVVITIIIFLSGYLNYELYAQSINKLIDYNEYYIIEPRALVLDSLYNLYVLDYGDMKIKKFNKYGEYLGFAGGRGRGPGEFINMTAIAVRDDKLYVIDASLFKIEEFSTSLNHINTYTANFSFELNTSNIIKVQSRIYFLEVSPWGDFSVIELDIKNDKFYKNKINLNDCCDSEGEITILNGYPGVLKVYDSSLIYMPYLFNKMYLIEIQDNYETSVLLSNHINKTPAFSVINDIKKTDIDFKLNGVRERVSLNRMAGDIDIDKNDIEYYYWEKNINSENSEWMLFHNKILEESDKKNKLFTTNYINIYNQSIKYFDGKVYLLQKDSVIVIEISE